MSLNNRIKNDMSSELSFVDLENLKKETKEEEKVSFIKHLKENLKFTISTENIFNYQFELIVLMCYLIISVISAFGLNFFPILSTLFTGLLIIFISANGVSIKNNKYLDVAMWNTSISLNLILKSFNLAYIKENYLEMLNLFSYMYMLSLLLSGIPAFNFINTISFIGLLVSFILCICNKDSLAIKDSLQMIDKKGFLLIIGSCVLFFLFSKGNVVNTGALCSLVLLKYIKIAIKDYNFTDIK